MLYRPPHETRLPAITTMLECWNAEADRYREAAIAARRGETPSSAVVGAAEEAQHGLIMLLEELGGALDVLAPGHADFAPLLQAQKTATHLLESIGISLGQLDRFAMALAPEPIRIGHRGLYLVAAE